MTLGSLLDGDQRNTDATVRIGGRLVGDRILVPIVDTGSSALREQIRVGVTLVQSTGGRLELTDPATDDDPVELDGQDETAAIDQALAWADERLERDRLHGVFAGRRAERRVHDRIEEGAFDTLVLPSAQTGGRLGGRRLERLASNVRCNVVTVNGDAEYRKFASLLLPIANGPHSGLATDVAGAIAEQSGAYVDILQVISPEADENERAAAQDRTDTAAERLGLPDTASTWLLEASDPAAAIVEQSTYYGLTVIGAPTVGRLHRLVYGSTSQSIREDAESVVIAARATAAAR